MSVFLLRMVVVLFGVLIFDGLVVGFLTLFVLADRVRGWFRSDEALWEAELSRSSRETAMRQQPAGGAQ